MPRDDAWMVDAACAKLSEERLEKLFWPAERKGYRRDFRAAKTVCAACPVRIHCYMFAIAHKIPYGVWGGRTEAERSHVPRALKSDIRHAWKSGTLMEDLM